MIRPTPAQHRIGHNCVRSATPLPTQPASTQADGETAGRAATYRSRGVPSEPKCAEDAGKHVEAFAPACAQSEPVLERCRNAGHGRHSLATNTVRKSTQATVISHTQIDRVAAASDEPET